MYTLRTIGTALLALAGTSLAAAVPELIERDSTCTHGPTTRSCWANGFSVATNSDAKFPDTGKTVTYNLEITSQTLSPDGVPRLMQVFNGQYPGPEIVADWGDTLQITVKNSLKDNGTSIHWHGFRQLHSNQMDGVNGITECPIAPGESKTYTFKATEYGGSWYHSHYSVQYADGLVGPITINGPSTANYDINLGTVPITDWFDTPVFTILASRPAAPPTSQSLLYNGLGVTGGVGKYATTTLTPGKKHKLTLVNTGTNQYIHVSLDNHPFTVVAADFIPIVPYNTSSLVISVGQRYDIIIDANQAVGNYWFRMATGGGQCDGPNQKNLNGDNLGAIFSYSGAPAGNPTSSASTLSAGCIEESNIVPYVKTTVPSPSGSPTLLDLTLDTTAGVFWKVNGEAIDISWKTPTISYVLNGTYSLPANDNGLTITGTGWTFWLIQNDTPLPHPIHLHGHNFWVAGYGAGSGAGVALNLDNPPRRDTHTVDAGGYLIVAFPADNPGAWLMHCHIPFHISGGLGVQFLERPSEIVGTIGALDDYNGGCKSWAAYQDSITGFSQGDSGLKRRNVRRM
ncbi:laccase-like multicopper oxidase [Venturia nashicola]|uniref:Laccase-like multicopper oxidase n=1 Tax=Venturia nashicola TaxID=86259 RepID=A0A4Z1NNG9_9PEZI|nr:laccase-like multicopper oxidase [Venturia nashicola]TLD26040.1 laccase-like multicopper oxidase [Venturia nashicola]